MYASDHHLWVYGVLSTGQLAPGRRTRQPAQALLLLNGCGGNSSHAAHIQVSKAQKRAGGGNSDIKSCFFREERDLNP